MEDGLRGGLLVVDLLNVVARVRPLVFEGPKCLQQGSHQALKALQESKRYLRAPGSGRVGML
jgi:hypothetical protein